MLIFLSLWPCPSVFVCLCLSLSLLGSLPISVSLSVLHLLAVNLSRVSEETGSVNRRQLGLDK